MLQNVLPEKAAIVIDLQKNLNKPIFLNDLVCNKKKVFIVVPDGVSATVYEHDSLQEIVFLLGAKSTLNFFSFITASGTKKIEIICEQEGAQANINGIYLFSENETAFLRTRQRHTARKTKTNLFLRGLLSGCSKVNHHGEIFIDKQACNVEAAQNNKTMLLSPDARVISCPELNVLNKDVRCSHGSAVGQMDKKQLFYLCSRGMQEDVARRLLLHTFLTLPFVQVGDRSFKKKFEQIISKKLQEIE